eukprot:6846187-Prymnesium_polylepis.1
MLIPDDHLEAARMRAVNETLSSGQAGAACTDSSVALVRAAAAVYFASNACLAAWCMTFLVDLVAILLPPNTTRLANA